MRTVLKLVGDGDFGQCAELSVRCLGPHSHRVDGVRLKTGYLAHRVRSDLDAEPALEVVVGVRAVVDAVAGHAVGWHRRRGIPRHYQSSRRRPTQLNVGRSRDRR